MSAVSSSSVFHQWLLAAAPESAAACSIILHGTPAALSSQLSAGIASYLNEYDDDCDGRWLAVQPELVPYIAEEAGRHLSGMAEAAGDVASGRPFGMQRALNTIAARGHVVMYSPLAPAATRGLDNVFHVGIGLPPDSLDECHIILNPDLFEAACLPRIVGDVFLEWLNCHGRKLASVHRQ
jgi:hypothetical protein